METKKIRGFTLIEILIGMAIIGAVSLVLYSMVNSATVLFATNFSINDTHLNQRRSLDRLGVMLEPAGTPAALIDSTGATVAGNGPAAGVRSYLIASPTAYQVTANVDAAGLTMSVRVTGLPAVRVGDVISINDLGFQSRVAAVSTPGTNQTVTFVSSAGNCFIPAKASGTVITSSAKCFLFSPSQVVAVNNQLRYYPHALSVATDGAAAFDNLANYKVVASLSPLGNATQSFPFQYLDTSRRSLDVTLPVKSLTYNNRVRAFNNFLSTKTTIAFRSAFVLRAIN
jgi:prepilin-type N-terminal cleavage/methylation domain-containing protein